MNLKDITEFFQKLVLLIGVGVTTRELLNVEISKRLLSQQKIQELCSFKRYDIFLLVAQNAIIQSIL